MPRHGVPDRGRKWDEVIDYLRARELVTNVYLERNVALAA
jgi:cation transport regulator ChaC